MGTICAVVGESLLQDPCARAHSECVDEMSEISNQKDETILQCDYRYCELHSASQTSPVVLGFVRLCNGACPAPAVPLKLIVSFSLLAIDFSFSQSFMSIILCAVFQRPSKFAGEEDDILVLAVVMQSYLTAAGESGILWTKW